MTGHRYLAFGLKVDSTRSISSLGASALPFVGLPDVEIIQGEVRDQDNVQNINGVEVNVEGDNYFLNIDECARFQVIGGRKIIVQADLRATPDQVDLYLLGSVFGVLLHQRGILPFHCNAVEIEGSAFLFCGDSGAGKSTLAAHFVERGFRLLTDDVCALNFTSDGLLLASPGVARLKLWQDALDLLGRSSAGLRLIPWYEKKYELPLTGENWGKPLPVAGLYHLRLAEGGRIPGIYPLKGLEAANSVTANIYRRRLADLTGAAPFYLAASARIIDRTPIFTMNRKWGFEHFLADALAAEDHMRRLIRDAASSRL